MHATIATGNPHVFPHRARTRGRGAAPRVQTLPWSIRAGVSVKAPTWMFIVGGGVIGGLLLGPLGAVGGALAGALLAR